MGKRNPNIHEECLREFGVKIKSEILSNIDFWSQQDMEAARNRALAFKLVINELKAAAQSTGCLLQDIGIEDFEVPLINK